MVIRGNQTSKFGYRRTVSRGNSGNMAYLPKNLPDLRDIHNFTQIALQGTNFQENLMHGAMQLPLNPRCHHHH